jgi:cytochrome c
MDSFELNKIFMAVLGTVFFIFGLSLLSESIYHPHSPETPGYAIAALESSEGGEEASEETSSGVEPIEALLASADPAAGEGVAKKCASCHLFVDGGGKKVGPGLYDIVGREIASDPEFGYSAALKEYGAGKTWTYEELNGFLANPKKHVPKTSMGFAGLKSVEERANIVAYLRSLSASPMALPDAGGAEQSSEAAPAEGTEAAQPSN